MNFEKLFQDAGDRISPFCLGLDPSRELLRAANLSDDTAGLRQFCQTLMSSASDLVSVIKPQIAYFERFGPDGLVELKRVIDMAHERGILVVLDAKRGDIDATCSGYAQAYLERGSYYDVDALTVTPYMGFDAMRVIFDAAADNGKGVFLVVMSSNPEGAAIQTATVQGSELTVAAMLAGQIAAYNEERGQKVLGAVLGATLGAQLVDLVERLNQGLILCPGIGHQGATFDDLAVPFAKARKTLIPTMARSVVKDGLSDNILRANIHAQNLKAVRFRTAPELAEDARPPLPDAAAQP